jgi:hypothetical protein
MRRAVGPADLQKTRRQKPVISVFTAMKTQESSPLTDLNSTQYKTGAKLTFVLKVPVFASSGIRRCG